MCVVSVDFTPDQTNMWMFCLNKQTWSLCTLNPIKSVNVLVEEKKKKEKRKKKEGQMNVVSRNQKTDFWQWAQHARLYSDLLLAEKGKPLICPGIQ